MIDLFSLTKDLKRKRYQTASALLVSQIYGFLCRPSAATRRLISGWREDFYRHYGPVSKSLSGNRKLHPHQLLARYHIPADNGEEEALQLLFFSIQTYFTLLIKCITRASLPHSSSDDSCEAILTGAFAADCGVTNYCSDDWYCWPLHELRRGFAPVMDAIRSHVASYEGVGDTVPLRRLDLIKQIYETLIPKELRHALGEYYTPDWLAFSTFQNALEICGAETPLERLSILDPTCGSGTFLVQAIAAKRRCGASLDDILSTVRGIDIHPLAVLTAKTNYLLSVADLLDGKTPITLPVYQGDVLQLVPPNKKTAASRQRSKDQTAIEKLEPADLVLGNPPWVNWEYLPEQSRTSSRHLWHYYGLLAAKGRHLSFSKEDLSVLITQVSMDKLLRQGGVLAFVIRQGLFKSAQNGAGFRAFRLGDTGIQVIRVEDLSHIKPFDISTTGAAVFYARKGSDTQYPVPYDVWRRRQDLRRASFHADHTLPEVLQQVEISHQWAVPSVREEPTSLWVTADAKTLDATSPVLGSNPYRARTGVFTGGANAVYWLHILDAQPGALTVTNVVERAKRKTETVTAALEPAYVYPMVKGGNIQRWKVSYDTYLLCPHTAETKIRPVAESVLEETAPLTMAYLRRFRAVLDGRSGFGGWEKGLQHQAFHAILRVGAYTFSRYKVVWRYIASQLICAVISTVRDEYLGEKLLLPNEKVMYISTDDEMEAYYLCGILSSTLVSRCVRSYLNPTSISAHVLSKLSIPPYDPTNDAHRAIAALCKEGHRQEGPYLRQIDALVESLYRAKPDNSD